MGPPKHKSSSTNGGHKMDLLIGSTILLGIVALIAVVFWILVIIVALTTKP